VITGFIEDLIDAFLEISAKVWSPLSPLTRDLEWIARTVVQEAEKHGCESYVRERITKGVKSLSAIKVQSLRDELVAGRYPPFMTEADEEWLCKDAWGNLMAMQSGFDPNAPNSGAVGLPTLRFPRLFSA